MLRMVLLLKPLLDKLSDLVLHRLRIVSLVLRNLSSQYLSELRNFEVTFGELSYPVDDRGGPLDSQLLEPIPLVQEGVHVLFHSLDA